jgi:hypothetical protein
MVQMAVIEAPDFGGVVAVVTTMEVEALLVEAEGVAAAAVEEKRVRRTEPVCTGA